MSDESKSPDMNKSLDTSTISDTDYSNSTSDSFIDNDVDIESEKGDEEQKGGDFKEDIKKTHKCGSIYQKIFEWVVVRPLKLLKTFLKQFPIPIIKNGRPTTTSIYDMFVEFAEDNRDYVLLFKIVAAIVTLGLMYYLYQQFFSGMFGLDLNRIANYLKTMDLTDLPMSENVNASMEAEALNCWSRYFTNFPYSFENAGFYDLVRGAVLLPFIFVFVTYILPIFLLIYIFWFLYHYIHLIIKAIGALVYKAFKFAINYIACTVVNKIPFASMSCPDLTEAFADWREEYVDEPIYQERLKYLKDFYVAKLNYVNKPMAYTEKLWRRGQVQADYSSKFLTRSKQVFYEKMLENQNYLDKSQRNITGRWGKFRKEREPTNTNTNTRNRPDLKTSMKRSAERIKKSVQTAYCNRNIIFSLLTIVSLLILLLIFGSYSLTGCPSQVFEWIGPLWRSVDLGSRLKLLSSRYNWAAIGLVLLIIGSLFIKMWIP